MDKNALFRDPKKPPESVKKTPKKALFWPPRNPQFWPLLDNSWPLFGPQIWPPKCQFLTKTPKTTLFRPPPDSKNPGKWPFWRKPGFSSKIWTAKRGGGWGFTQGPPKRPFLAIFDHFWPFLAIFDPQNGPTQTPQKDPLFYPLFMWVDPPKPLWPRGLYLIIGLLGRKFGICAENEDFSAPPQVREMWVNLAAIPRLLF